MELTIIFSCLLVIIPPFCIYLIGEWINKESSKINNGLNVRSRCCGRCDGINDECITDMFCDTHREAGCEICWPHPEGWEYR
jgi:hypothetical protein